MADCALACRAFACAGDCARNAAATRWPLRLFAQFENVSAFVLVYDVTSPESFTSCNQWIELIRQLRPEKPLPGAANSPITCMARVPE